MCISTKHESIQPSNKKIIMKGICFTEPLFHKVVKGEKTQTRRMITIQPPDNRNWRIGTLMDSTAKEDKKKIGKNHYLLFENEYTIKESDGRYFSPKYQAGEIIYLKEPYLIYQESYQELKTSESGISITYKYGSNISIEEIAGDTNAKWKNKLFMPESAARYFIEITGVRAERLQDISEEDYIKEGIDKWANLKSYPKTLKGVAVTWGWCDGISYENHKTAKEAYAALINNINGKGTWESNPFVWVYDFRLIEK